MSTDRMSIDVGSAATDGHSDKSPRCSLLGRLVRNLNSFDNIRASGADEGCHAWPYLLQCHKHVLRTFGNLTKPLASTEEAERWACPGPLAQ